MIIGLTGKYQSGKDTVADHLVERYEFRKVGFSDALYDAVANLFEISVEDALEFKNENMGYTVQIHQGFQCVASYTWREVLQRFGTEMGRGTFGHNFWVEVFKNRYMMIPQNIVVRDVRFDNEAALIDDHGGHIWHIQRPGFEGDAHPSEAGVHEAYIEADIDNSGTLEELYELIDKAMTEVYGFDNHRR